MNAETVAAFLVNNGDYQIFDPHPKVAGVEFNFSSVLRGPGQTGRLVVVLDVDSNGVGVLRRHLAAFALTLERSRTFRPLAAVVVGRTLRPADFRSFQRICRTLNVGPDSSLARALRPLLPLPLPGRTSPIPESADQALEDAIQGIASPSFRRSLMRAAQEGPDAVAAVVRRRVEEISKQALSTEGDLD